ncbi:MAG: toxin-antitoxin system HicB family antitoxin [Desulfobulbaceae bacterium]|nr:toxin-antitoxin system HicB family antitoxin [Desulfobulbaceae bacterium]
MKGMNHKGYYAKVEFGPEDHIFVGLLLASVMLSVFMGNPSQNSNQPFVRQLITTWQPETKLDKSQTKPYSGNLMLRIPAEIHVAVAAAAEANGKSINQWADGVLDKESRAH